MTINDHPVTDWAAQNEKNIAKHRSQPLKPHNQGGLFGRNIFGFASQTLGISPGGPLGMVGVGGLGDMDALLSAGKTWATSWIGQQVNRYLSDGGNRGKLNSIYDKALAGYESHGKGLEHMGHNESEGMATQFRKQAEKEADYEVNRKGEGIPSITRELIEELDSTLLYGAWEGYRYNHKLENKGHLSFTYDSGAFGQDVLTPLTTESSPNTLTYGGEEFKIFRLPFFENPKISESRNAVYASHDIVNRNEPYRLWVGAKAKKVNVSFNITGPHLVTFAKTLMSDQVKGALMSQGFKDYLRDLIKEQNDMELMPQDEGTFRGGVSGLGSYGTYRTTLNTLEAREGEGSIGDQASPRRHLVIYTMYLLNLIRSSVIGSTNTSSPDGGTAYQKSYIPAPIIFLTHGVMYDKEPFIATNYSINFDGKHGYEELSMLPRVISIKLTLESYNQFEKSDTTRGLSRLFTPPQE